jgi:L,D-peptidoglycan transpeptidase YkuD (ErfK/YbiS/YcfS/YnhG family)
VTKATPIGKWRLKSLFYRSDKVLRPLVKNKTFKINKITKNCGWCDDPKSYHYNKYINLKKNLMLKSLILKNYGEKIRLTDLVIETSHNTSPID